MSPLFTGYISAVRWNIKRRILFTDVQLAAPTAIYTEIAESLAEVKVMAYAEAIQRWPAEDGWQDHNAEMIMVPAEMIRAAAREDERL